VKKERRFAGASAFRQALEARLNQRAKREGLDVQRLRRQVAFDRLLCRLFSEGAAHWALKGGYAMELRIAGARATRDIDLALRQRIQARGEALNLRILKMLQAAAAQDKADFFTFTIGEPGMDLDGAPYGGARYPVECRMDGRVFARFHLDVGVGDTIIEPLEEIHGQAWLNFAGIPAAVFLATPREQQFAEKLHAYTLPRGERPNSRVRDLVDMVLLIHGGLDVVRLVSAVAKTFRHRATHDIPQELLSPPSGWEGPFAELAEECGLPPDIATGFEEVAGFVASLNLPAPTHSRHSRRASDQSARARQRSKGQD
jgi:hypothetical protein